MNLLRPWPLHSLPEKRIKLSATVFENALKHILAATPHLQCIHYSASSCGTGTRPQASALPIRLHKTRLPPVQPCADHHYCHKNNTFSMYRYCSCTLFAATLKDATAQNLMTASSPGLLGTPRTCPELHVLLA